MYKGKLSIEPGYININIYKKDNDIYEYLISQGCKGKEEIKDIMICWMQTKRYLYQDVVFLNNSGKSYGVKLYDSNKGLQKNERLYVIDKYKSKSCLKLFCQKMYPEIYGGAVYLDIEEKGIINSSNILDGFDMILYDTGSQDNHKLMLYSSCISGLRKNYNGFTGENVLKVVFENSEQITEEKSGDYGDSVKKMFEICKRKGIKLNLYNSAGAVRVKDIKEDKDGNKNIIVDKVEK